MDSIPIVAMHFSKPHHVEKRLRAFADNVKRLGHTAECVLTPFRMATSAWVDADTKNNAWLFASVDDKSVVIHGMFNGIELNGEPLYFTIGRGGILYIGDAKEKAKVFVTASRVSCSTQTNVWECYNKVTAQMGVPNLLQTMPLVEACLAKIDDVYVEMDVYREETWFQLTKMESVINVRDVSSHKLVVRFVAHDEVWP